MSTTDPATEAELDHIVANMKRAAMYSRYIQIVRDMIPPTLLHSGAPMFRQRVATSSMNVAAMAAARQGYDAGRWAPYPASNCPYLGLDGRSVFLRRAYFIGYAEGMKVAPRPEPRELDHQPVTIK